METPNFQLKQSLRNPLYQAVFVLMIALPFMLIGGMVSSKIDFAWTSASAFLLFFGVLNAISSISSTNLDKYWGKSVLSFILFAIITALIAWGLSGLSIYEVPIHKSIYLVLIFAYLVFLSIIGFMKRIVEFAEQEDWQSPRKKNRTRNN